MMLMSFRPAASRRPGGSVFLGSPSAEFHLPWLHSFFLTLLQAAEQQLHLLPAASAHWARCALLAVRGLSRDQCTTGGAHNRDSALGPLMAGRYGDHSAESVEDHFTFLRTVSLAALCMTACAPSTPHLCPYSYLETPYVDVPLMRIEVLLSVVPLLSIHPSWLRQF